MSFKDQPYALVVIGVVVAVITLGTVWFVAGQGKKLPAAANGPTLTPEQETIRAQQGESRLGKDQGGAARDTGDTGGR